MGYCKWCKRKMTKSYKINHSTEVCEDCYKAYKDKVCWKCHEPLGMNSIDGKCSKCYQIEYSDKQRKNEEIAMGISRELQELFSSPLEFTDEDYNKWMTTNISGVRVTKQLRDKIRKEWLYANMVNKYNWTKESIDKNYEYIEKILDRNFSKMVGKKMIIIDTKTTNIKIVSCEDIEGSIVLINSSEINK